MQAMIILVPELTGYASVRYVEVSLPLVAELVDGRKYYMPDTVPRPEGYRERARRFVSGTGLADGDPRIRVGTTVNLSSLGDLFNGKYAVVRVRHTYDETVGYRTEFDVERPGLGQPRG